MVEQYPHSITITPQADPVQGVNGDFAAPVAGTPVTSECRAEPAGNDPFVSGPNGDKVSYQFIVYMPPVTTQFGYGDPVVITMDNGSLFSGFVKQQYNGQFNTRLWV